MTSHSRVDCPSKEWKELTGFYEKLNDDTRLLNLLILDQSDRRFYLDWYKFGHDLCTGNPNASQREVNKAQRQSQKDDGISVRVGPDAKPSLGIITAGRKYHERLVQRQRHLTDKISRRLSRKSKAQRELDHLLESQEREKVATISRPRTIPDYYWSGDYDNLERESTRLSKQPQCEADRPLESKKEILATATTSPRTVPESSWDEFYDNLERGQRVFSDGIATRGSGSTRWMYWRYSLHVELHKRRV